MYDNRPTEPHYETELERTPTMDVQRQRMVLFYHQHRGYWYESSEIGLLKPVISYNVKRQRGHCLYFQVIPSDGPEGLEYITAELPMIVNTDANIVFTSHSENPPTRRTLSQISVQFNNPNNIKYTTCPNLDKPYMRTENDVMKRYYLYLNIWKTPLINFTYNDSITRMVQNINQLQFNGPIIACTWFGLSLKVELRDFTSLQCISREVFINKPESSDFTCGRFIFETHNATLPHADTPSFAVLPLRREQLHWFFQFSISNTRNILDTYLLINIGAQCTHELDPDLLYSVKLYSVIQTIGRGGQKPVDASYIIMAGYHNAFKMGKFITVPTYFSSGMYFKQSNSLMEKCYINVQYRQKCMQIYTGPLKIDYISVHQNNTKHANHKQNNQWKMCWNNKCYMAEDDKFIPSHTSWIEAEQFCQKHHGHIVSINSDAEQTVVLEWLLNKRRELLTEYDFYGFSSLLKISTLMFLGLHRNNQVGLICMI